MLRRGDEHRKDEYRVMFFGAFGQSLLYAGLIEFVAAADHVISRSDSRSGAFPDDAEIPAFPGSVADYDDSGVLGPGHPADRIADRFRELRIHGERICHIHFQPAPLKLYASSAAVLVYIENFEDRRVGAASGCHEQGDDDKRIRVFLGDLREGLVHLRLPDMKIGRMDFGAYDLGELVRLDFRRVSFGAAAGAVSHDEN